MPHLWSRNRFLWLFGTQFFHGIVVLFLLFCHKDILTSKVKRQDKQIWLQPFSNTVKMGAIKIKVRIIFLKKSGSHLFLLLVEVVDDHTNEEVKGEEGAKYDEDNKVDVHVDVDFIVWLVLDLRQRRIKLKVILGFIKKKYKNTFQKIHELSRCVLCKVTLLMGVALYLHTVYSTSVYSSHTRLKKPFSQVFFSL